DSRRGTGSLRGTRSRLGLHEQAPRILDVPRSFQERLGIPLAPRSWRREEVPTVDVDRSRQLADGIDHRMDDIRSEQSDVADAERASARGLDAAGGAPPEHVVLAPREDADYGPHAVVVRLEAHPRSPREVEDGQLRRVVEQLEAGVLGFAHPC